MQLSHIYALTPVFRRLKAYGPSSEYINQSKKRKRSLTPSEGEESEEVQEPIEEDDEDDESTARVVSNLPALTPDQIEQYRTAGIAPCEEIPPRPFPAADFPSSKSGVLEESTKELSELRPPLYNPFDDYNAKSADRERHLGVVNTIMHHMLLKGDYQRAGRAWGMILRASYTGTDLRRLGRWAIGAEILLRSDRSSDSGDVIHGADSTSTRDSPPEESDTMFSARGFNLAKAYYEKLIIQYPYKHNQSNAVPSNFYPALFSCWIYQVTERARLSKLRAKKDYQQHDLGYELSDSEREHSLSPSHFDSSLRLRMQLIRERELEDAQAIAARFDIIIDSPPHDRNPELLRLRGMISQWIAHLLDSDDATSNEDSSGSEEDEDPNSTTMHGRTGKGLGRDEERKVNLERAENMLSRAQNVTTDLENNT
jgi:hypothetical protein